MDVFEEFEEMIDEGMLQVVDFLHPERDPYTVRERVDNWHNWDEREFMRRFRLSKRTIQILLDKIEPQLRHHMNDQILPLTQLLLTLKFLASGCFYIASGDFVGIHKSTAGRIIARVVKAIVGFRRQFIIFPITPQEQQETVYRFAGIARFPRVVGALDCTHVNLISPGGPNAETLRNRKGYMSLNVQVICNAENKIVDVVAKWTDATHDSHIFNNSAIRMKFESGTMGNLLLLGDSGYPVKSYSMAPLANTRTAAENLYNEAQIQIRNVVEKTFGIWKRGFPILSIGLRYKLPLAQQIITATAILHNLAINQRDVMPHEDTQHEETIVDVGLANVGEIETDAVRRSIIQYFESLQ